MTDQISLFPEPEAQPPDEPKIPVLVDAADLTILRFASDGSLVRCDTHVRPQSTALLVDTYTRTQVLKAVTDSLERAGFTAIAKALKYSDERIAADTARDVDALLTLARKQQRKS